MKATIKDTTRGRIKKLAALHSMSPDNFINHVLDQFTTTEQNSSITATDGVLFIDPETQRFILWARRIKWDNLLWLQPLTIEQIEKILQQNDMDHVCKTLIKMESYRPIIHRKSLYLTLKDWLKR